MQVEKEAHLHMLWRDEEMEICVETENNQETAGEKIEILRIGRGVFLNQILDYAQLKL